MTGRKKNLLLSRLGDHTSDRNGRDDCSCTPITSRRDVWRHGDRTLKDLTGLRKQTADKCSSSGWRNNGNGNDDGNDSRRDVRFGR